MRHCFFCIFVLIFCFTLSGLAMDHRDDILFEDFESNDGGFVSLLDWEWGIFTWSGASCTGNNMPPTSAYSGDGMWGTVLNDCYSNLGNNSGYDTCINGDPSDDSILSFDVDLTSHADATLSFYEWFDVFLQWDWTEILVNGTVVHQHCGDTFVEPTQWEEVVIDLTPYVGDIISVEFHMLSSTVVNRSGWYIDDVRVYTGAPPPTATPEPTPPPTTTPHPTTTPFPTFTPTPDCIHDGDVNQDNDVTAGDAQMAFQIALGSITPTYEQACAADCNGDEAVTAGDAQQIFFVVLGSGTCVDPI